MALGRRCRDSRAKNGAESELIGLGAVHATRGLRRKRIGISKEESCHSEFRSTLKRQCSAKFEVEFDTCLLLRHCLRSSWVLCGVEHANLKKVLLVSKTVMEAALDAKRTHFAYSTPKKVKAFRNPVRMDDSGEEIEAPNAPRQFRFGRRRISQKTMEDLAVSLFQSDDEKVK